MENLGMTFWNGKRILITGHTGFKGSWLTFWLKSLGAEICGYALAPERSPSLFENLRIAGQITSVIGDINDLPNFQKTLSDFEPEIVFHLAAQSLVRRSYREPVQTYQTNLMGTVNVMEAVRHCDSVKAVVIVTTDKVYENKEWLWAYRENERLGGFDPYSNSKACAELAVSAYRNSFFSDGQKLIASARAGNVIGGGDWCEDRLIPDVFRSLIFGQELLIRNPNSVRPWQHVLEPLSGYLMLAENLFSGNRTFAGAWNFGPRDEDSQTVGAVLEKIKFFWNEDVNWRMDKGDHPHEANLLKLDSTKAKQMLGWKPRLSLDESIRLTVDWYHAFKEDKDLNDFTQEQIEFYMRKARTGSAV